MNLFPLFICICENNVCIGAAVSRTVFLRNKYVEVKRSFQLKHTTALFALSDHYILSREWRVTGDQAQANYHGRPMGL